jgi:hypothetical protein
MPCLTILAPVRADQLHVDMGGNSWYAPFIDGHNAQQWKQSAWMDEANQVQSKR